MSGEKEFAEKPGAEILEAVRRATPEGKITCTAARKLAAEYKVHPRVIGRACDELKVKIHSCELGCF